MDHFLSKSSNYLHNILDQLARLDHTKTDQQHFISFSLRYLTSVPYK